MTLSECCSQSRPGLSSKPNGLPALETKTVLYLRHTFRCRDCHRHLPSVRTAFSLNGARAVGRCVAGNESSLCQIDIKG